MKISHFISTWFIERCNPIIYKALHKSTINLSVCSNFRKLLQGIRNEFSVLRTTILKVCGYRKLRLVSSLSAANVSSKISGNRVHCFTSWIVRYIYKKIELLPEILLIYTVLLVYQKLKPNSNLEALPVTMFGTNLSLGANHYKTNNSRTFQNK